LRSRKAYIPAGYLGTKRMGELAELGFMYRAATYGIGVAKPHGDSFPYDVLTQHGKRLLRVQVKSCFQAGRYGNNGFTIRVVCGGGEIHYSVDEVDFIAAFIAKHDTWYLIPMESLGQRKNIHLYPGRRRIKPGCGLFEQYRESWHLLQDQNHSRSGPACATGQHPSASI
jgi:hypothetical protein